MFYHSLLSLKKHAALELNDKPSMSVKYGTKPTVPKKPLKENLQSVYQSLLKSLVQTLWRTVFPSNGKPTPELVKYITCIWLNVHMIYLIKIVYALPVSYCFSFWYATKFHLRWFGRSSYQCGHSWCCVSMRAKVVWSVNVVLCWVRMSCMCACVLLEVIIINNNIHKKMGKKACIFKYFHWKRAIITIVS